MALSPQFRVRRLGDECDIVATAMAPGYVPEDAPATTLVLRETFIALVWGSFPTDVAVGESVDLSASGDRPESNPAADSVTVVVDSGDCSYSASDVLSFSGLTPCVVTVTANKANYSSIERTFSVTPTLGNIVFASRPIFSFSGDLRIWRQHSRLTHGASR